MELREMRELMEVDTTWAHRMVTSDLQLGLQVQQLSATHLLLRV